MLREPNFMSTWGMHHRMLSSFAAMLAWMPVTGAVVHACLARAAQDATAIQKAALNVSASTSAPRQSIRHRHADHDD
jgi:hypothetical protein